MTEALAQLVDKGEKHGELKTVERFVRNLTADGFSFDQIVRLTGAPADDVQKIMDKIEADSQVQTS